MNFNILISYFRNYFYKLFLLSKSRKIKINLKKELNLNINYKFLIFDL